MINGVVLNFIFTERGLGVWWKIPGGTKERRREVVVHSRDAGG